MVFSINVFSIINFVRHLDLYKNGCPPILIKQTPLHKMHNCISNVISVIAIDSNTFVVFGFSLKNLINLLIFKQSHINYLT